MTAQDLFIRLTDPAGKHSPIVTQHRVWDRDRFIRSMQHQFGEGAKSVEDCRTVTVVDRDAYTATRKGS